MIHPCFMNHAGLEDQTRNSTLPTADHGEPHSARGVGGGGWFFMQSDHTFTPVQARGGPAPKCSAPKCLQSLSVTILRAVDPGAPGLAGSGGPQGGLTGRSGWPWLDAGRTEMDGKRTHPRNPRRWYKGLITKRQCIVYLREIFFRKHDVL